MISIHVPRVGDDRISSSKISTNRHFYPRPPRGGRHASLNQTLDEFFISIHVPRVGDDRISSNLSR